MAKKENEYLKTVVGMALWHYDDGGLFDKGFSRRNVSATAHPAIDEALRRGLIKEVTIYSRTAKGDKFWQSEKVD